MTGSGNARRVVHRAWRAVTAWRPGAEDFGAAGAIALAVLPWTLIDRWVRPEGVERFYVVLGVLVLTIAVLIISALEEGRRLRRRTGGYKQEGTH